MALGFDATINREWPFAPIDFRTRKSSFRKNAQLIKTLLVGILSRPVVQMLAPRLFRNSMLRHEIQPIPHHHCARRFHRIQRAVAVEEDSTLSKRVEDIRVDGALLI